ncbi:MAG TPA: sulfatase-like hydrolase/transferase [Geminicoccaceae bacterium]|nr:sulfatase-like hydrolase/transferase [Geminicoccaceae bacterium]
MTSTTSHAQAPNVLLVLVDQWPGRLLGVSGHPVIQTPTIDAIARSGVRFTRAYSECPICIPARRTLMTGTTTRTHGDRVFNTVGRMPELPTLAQCFGEAGYQTFAVGKLHVYPPRDRIGFDDVLLAEEGRPHLGGLDDYEIFLADRGYPGQQYLHGMNNNNYMHRPWHLPEDCHVTNWTSMQMARTIKRRDPTRPAFWCVSYTPPHPPLIPLQSYVDYYRAFEIPSALRGDWSEDPALPLPLRMNRAYYGGYQGQVLMEVRRAFYALCTHIDHQFRIVIGTLREEGILDDTIVMIAADHGEMLGDFGLFAKRTYYEGSGCVPMALMGRAGDPRVGHHRVDDRLVGLQDVMPTLLDLAGIPVPESCDGLSMVGERRRRTLYGDCLENASATRMLHDGRHKLIWYPAGNHLQLFDLEEDPGELRNRADDPDYAEVRKRMVAGLVEDLYGIDVEQGWAKDGKLVGFAAPPYEERPDRGLNGQRGLHFPQPPLVAQDVPVGFPT